MVQISRKLTGHLLVTPFFLLSYHWPFWGHRLKDSAYMCNGNWAFEVLGYHPGDVHVTKQGGSSVREMVGSKTKLISTILLMLFLCE